MVGKLGFKFNNEIRASSNHDEPNVEAKVELYQELSSSNSSKKKTHCTDVSGKDPNFSLKIQGPKELVVFLVYLRSTFKNCAGKIC